MKSRLMSLTIALSAPYLALPAAATAANETESTAVTAWIAGLAPYQRPQEAPVIRELRPASDWRSRALTGIVEPIPASLNFLDHQGAWYTPFSRAGMTGYYDLRHWHDHATTDPGKPGR